MAASLKRWHVPRQLGAWSYPDFAQQRGAAQARVPMIARDRDRLVIH